MQPTFTQITELGFQLQLTNDYYYKDYGNIRLGIIESNGRILLSRNPFDYVPLTELDDVEQLKRIMSAADYYSKHN